MAQGSETTEIFGKFWLLEISKSFLAEKDTAKLIHFSSCKMDAKRE